MKSANLEVKRILEQFGQSHIMLILAMLVSLITSGLMEIYPIKYMQAIVDSLNGQSVFKEIIVDIAFWYGFRLVGALTGFISGYLAGKIGATLGGNFRRALFERLEHSSYMALRKGMAAEAVTRTLNDVHDLGNALIRPIYVVGKNMAIFVWALYFLARIDWILLLVCIPLGVVMLVVGGMVAKKNKAVWKENKLFQTKIADSLFETLAGAREILIFNFWNRQNERFDRNNRGVVNSQINGSKLTNLLNSITEALWPVATVLCLTFGSYRVIHGDLSMGGWISFMWYVQWVIHPISQLANYYAEIQSGVVAAERIEEMMKWFPGDKAPSSPVDFSRHFKLEGVSFFYSGEKKQGIRNINLAFEIGETIAIVGETGCGKSTLINVLLGLVEPLEGKIIVDGNVVSSADLCGAPFLAASFQNPYIFNGTVQENIEIGNRSGDFKKKLELDEVINIVCLEDVINGLPEGVKTIIGDKGHGLSTGQLQRVGLARALYKRPKVLLLDEATVSLDTAIETNIYNNILAKNDKLACVIVSHRLASIINADRIYFMEDGEIVAFGTHAELLKNCVAYRQLYHAQLIEEQMSKVEANSDEMEL